VILQHTSMGATQSLAMKKARRSRERPGFVF
jgi:hypothetical protein